MLARSVYTCLQAFRYRMPLHQVKSAAINSLNEIKFSELAEKQQALIWDFDGVLASHGELTPDPHTEAYLKASIEAFGAGKVFILSNKPLAEREVYFKQYFPGVVFIKASKKKPYPDGLWQIASLLSCSPDKLTLIDDRLLTGSLAAVQVSADVIYLQKPLQNFKKRFLVESFFQFLRSAERVFF